MAKPTVVFVALLLSLAGPSLAKRNETHQPHIIFILVDDWGWNDVSYHGSDQIPTPNIDALAYNGVIFRKNYVQPLCTPSRSALMTGMYPMRLGMQGVPIVSGERRALPDGKIFPQYMKDLGYATHAIGKWHLGFYDADKTPVYRGFDTFLGYWNGLISYYDHITGVQESEALPKGMYGHDMRRNMTPAWDVQGEYATHVFTNEALEIIRKHNPAQPLFMYFAHLGVHGGMEGNLVQAPQETVREFSYIPNPNRQTLAAMVTEVDRSVGDVVSMLEKKNMLNNSIIVVMSDNGAPTFGYYENWGSNYPLRGLKGTQWEGAVRGSALIWSPRIQKRSRVSSKKMHVVDWLPTLYTAAGGNVDDLNSTIDGLNQWDVLVNDADAVRTEFLVDMNEQTESSSYIDGNWKLVQGTDSIHNENYNGYYGDNGQQAYLQPVGADKVWNSKAGVALARLPAFNPLDDKEIQNLRSQVQITCGSRNSSCNPQGPSDMCLFDLENDPCETTDLLNDNPDVVSSILKKLAVLRNELVPRTDPYQLAEADPRLWGGNWAPWSSCEEENFRYCTATPNGFDPLKNW